jgi:hypothetical protein
MQPSPVPYPVSPAPAASPYAAAPPARARRSLWGWLGVVLVALALLALLVLLGRALLLYAQHALLALNYPYPLNYGESPLLDQALRLARGENIYSLVVPPYTIGNYPPVYPLLQAPFVGAFGPSFFYGRVLSVIAALLAAVGIGWTARNITRDAVAGIVAGGLFLAVPYVLHWTVLNRVDALALAFSVLGAAVATGWPRRTAALALAALLCALAVFTRQTAALAAPLAIALYVWGQGGLWRAIVFGLWFGVLLSGGFALLLVLSEGGAYFHLFTANINRFNALLPVVYAFEMARHFPLLLGLALGFVLFGWYGFGRGGQPLPRTGWLFAVPYLLGGLVVALTIAKVGSDVNYLFEWSAALCVAAGAVVAWLRRAPLVRAVGLLALAVQVAALHALSESRYVPIVQQRTAQRAEADQLYDRIAQTPGRVIADEANGLLLLAGQRLWLQPFEYSELARAGVWNQTPLLIDLAQGTFPVVILYNPVLNPDLRFERWTDDMLRIINERYRPVAQLAEHTVYQYVGLP